MTHNNQENLAMVDAVTTKYGKTTVVTLSKTLSIILVVIFFVCLVATGLLVYSFTSACPKNETSQLPPQVITTNHCSTTEITTTTRTTLTIPTSPITTATTKIEEVVDIRLPTSVIPDYYTIELIPFIEPGNFTYHGEEKIIVNVTEDTKNISIHSVGLTIESVKVTKLNNESISVTDVRFIDQKQFTVIDLDGFLHHGEQYNIFIKFKGVLNDMLQGFYRSSYMEHNTTRWIAATQFQPTDARKAFPCFDEPAFKARFQINIARKREMTSISNMPKSSSSDYLGDLQDYVWDHFEPTLPMSTYLVAFVISDFEKISDGIFSVWARKSATSQAIYALEIAPIILRFYENFFQSKYPLPKVDMVALPDFSSGAMENWGLITYRETTLLYDEGVSSSLSKQHIGHVIAHELAHQWFGNLVTPVWWEDLWLNEGFATYVEFLGAHAVNKKWKNMEYFVVAVVHESLALDALKTSHPISMKVNNPEEVNDIFDHISYSKSAAILRMMKQFLGDKVFRAGLHKYLQTRMYQNAEQDDLWQGFTDEAQHANVLPQGATVKDIMDTWTLQTGYPVVTARSDTVGGLLFYQERFLINQEEIEQSDSLWWIPITVMTSYHNKSSTWITKQKDTHLNGVLDQNPDWYLVNIHQTGFYRVNYERQNWEALIRQLGGNGHRLIDPRNRAQLIDDAFKLAYTGYIEYDIALNATLYLVNEREFIPWKAAMNNFQFLYEMFLRTGHFDKFKRYLTLLIRDFYDKLGFKEIRNEEYTNIMSRIEIVETACRLGVKDCVIQAVQLFQNWRNSANPDKDNLINPGLRQTVYCTAINYGGQEEWDFAWNRYLNTNVASDKDTLLNSLSCSKDIWILSRYLEWSITENSGIRKQDASRVFAGISENPVGQDLIYRFMKTNWKRIREYFGSTSNSLSTVVRSATSNFNTAEELNDFKSFFARHGPDFGIATRSAQQSIEQGEANTKWMEEHFEYVKTWFERVEI